MEETKTLKWPFQEAAMIRWSCHLALFWFYLVIMLEILNYDLFIHNGQHPLPWNCGFLRRLPPFRSVLCSSKFVRVCLCVRHDCLFSFIGQAPRTSTFITVLAFCYKLTRAQIHRLDRRTSRDLKRPETKGPAREKCSFLKTIEAFFKLFTRLPLLLFHLYLPKY